MIVMSEIQIDTDKLLNYFDEEAIESLMLRAMENVVSKHIDDLGDKWLIENMCYYFVKQIKGKKIDNLEKSIQKKVTNTVKEFKLDNWDISKHDKTVEMIGEAVVAHEKHIISSVDEYITAPEDEKDYGSFGERLRSHVVECMYETIAMQMAESIKKKETD